MATKLDGDIHVADPSYTTIVLMNLSGEPVRVGYTDDSDPDVFISIQNCVEPVLMSIPEAHLLISALQVAISHVNQSGET